MKVVIEMGANEKATVTVETRPPHGAGCTVGTTFAGAATFIPGKQGALQEAHGGTIGVNPVLPVSTACVFDGTKPPLKPGEHLPHVNGGGIKNRPPTWVNHTMVSID